MFEDTHSNAGLRFGQQLLINALAEPGDLVLSKASLTEDGRNRQALKEI